MSTVSKENQDDENSIADYENCNESEMNDETVNDNGSCFKKKFGKFRILGDEQSPSNENSIEINQLDTQQQLKSTPEPFIPPTLLVNNQINENNSNETAAAEEEEEDEDKPKKGKPGRKKGFKMKKVMIIDENDNDSNSPLRRRSSRLKVLEEKKETTTNELESNDNSSEIKDENEVNAISKNNNELINDTNNNIDNLDRNELNEVEDRIDNNTNDNLGNEANAICKEKRKDKKKKDKKKSKKHDKRKTRRRKSSKDENLSDHDNLDNRPNDSSDCFNAPSIAISNLNNSNSSNNDLKPEKVKSRWRRNSELESGHNENLISSSSNKKDALSSSENLINNENNNVNSSKINFSNNLCLTSSSSSSISSLNTHSSIATQNENAEPMPEFKTIESNLYLVEKKKTKIAKEIKKMVCDCILTKEERSRGVMGCGEDCLNRILFIECGSRCSLNDHCANKRFLKKQYSKVEAFKTLRKGWGLRASEQLNPGQFLMEYVGEVIGPNEFKIRVKKYSKEERIHSFFMALKADEIIDATYKGNITRFINHSCEPNSSTLKWTVAGELRIGFFSTKFIAPGEEITFDYQFQRYGYGFILKF